MADDSGNIENNTKQQRKQVSDEAKTQYLFQGLQVFEGFICLVSLVLMGGGWVLVVFVVLCMCSFGFLTLNSAVFIPLKSQS